MKKLFSTQKTILAAGALCVMAVFASCLKTNDNDNPDTPVAGLMAFNLSPDKSAIGIALSGNNLPNTALAYTNYTGGYLSIYPGTRSVEAYNAGSGTSFTASDFTFNEGQYYSLFVVGADSVYRNVVVNDALDSLSPASGKAYIRYINAIPDSSQPLVTVSDNASSVISENAAFASVSGFVAINPGNANIAINDNNSIQATRSVALEERKVYTILFAGIPGATDTTQSVQIRYIENGTLSADSTAQQGVSVTAPRSEKIN
ncbi:DUF4397 domain-containing protein [Agriterribacter sp.]|uniref:DUF4397 domain-containing protein n=1 Tax=Agriterribacter sp. TaxID=2821509 RepID=UPI002C351A43|nr:DUF4397 domain-containing protein [Agriterribacter sp.]HRO48386.1 DUF4397 domain-containing protein [Agriterribacter sp.]HRQ16607.1 DUF4397 domain-containing protein [Agriterribacter sp.]